MRQAGPGRQQQPVPERMYVIGPDGQQWHIGTPHEAALCGYRPFGGWLAMMLHAPRARGVCGTCEQEAAS